MIQDQNSEFRIRIQNSEMQVRIKGFSSTQNRSRSKRLTQPSLYSRCNPFGAILQIVGPTLQIPLRLTKCADLEVCHAPTPPQVDPNVGSRHVT